MSIAYHKKNNKTYIQYTVRIEEEILEKLKKISHIEDISVNEAINQSLQYAINNYEFKIK